MSLVYQGNQVNKMNEMPEQISGIDETITDKEEKEFDPIYLMGAKILHRTTLQVAYVAATFSHNLGGIVLDRVLGEGIITCTCDDVVLLDSPQALRMDYITNSNGGMNLWVIEMLSTGYWVPSPEAGRMLDTLNQITKYMNPEE